MGAGASGPLNWLRVIDCTTGRLAMAGALLAEYGADVIKVESSGAASTADATIRATHDRGKRSVELDLTSDKGRAVLLDLVATADVLLASWEPGAATAIGLDDDELHRRNPGLVRGSISTWGEGSLDRRRPSAEPLVDAWIGTMGEQAKMARFMNTGPSNADRDGPVYYGMPMATTGASYLIVIGVLGALYRRFDDGLGRHVWTSLVDGALAYLSCPWRDADVPNPPRTPGRNFVCYVRCGDGEYLGIHTGAVGAFDRLMTAMGLSDLIMPGNTNEASFARSLTAKDVEILNTEGPKIFASRSRDEWEQALTEADVCSVPCLRLGEMFDHPQVLANNMAVTVDDPVLGSVTQIGVATRFSATPGAIQGPAPAPGADTAAVLSEHREPMQPIVISQQLDDRPLLAGVKVVDLGQYYAGPFGARLLGDLGADVIKLEPLLGDPLRGMDPGGPSEAAQFRKRSIAVNLKSDEGRAVAQRLFASADIIHHNMRPGVAERLGLGYDDAVALRQDIIYDFAPGWGGSGPYVARQGFAPMYSGFVGAAFECGGVSNPPNAPIGHEDPGNGLLGAAGMLAALLHRRRSGQGQLIEHSQLNATMTHMRHVVRTADGSTLGTLGVDTRRVGVHPLRRIYQTADGWVCVVAASESQARGLCEALGEVELVDSIHCGSGEPTFDDAELIDKRLEAAFASRASSEITAALDHGGVPNEVVPMENCQSAMTDPVNLAERRVYEWRDPRRGKVREFDHLIRLSDAQLPAGRERPVLGEHTSEILLELGYTGAEINALYDSGVVRA